MHVSTGKMDDMEELLRTLSLLIGLNLKAQADQVNFLIYYMGPKAEKICHPQYFGNWSWPLPICHRSFWCACHVMPPAEVQEAFEEQQAITALKSSCRLPHCRTVMETNPCTCHVMFFRAAWELCSHKMIWIWKWSTGCQEISYTGKVRIQLCTTRQGESFNHFWCEACPWSYRMKRSAHFHE